MNKIKIGLLQVSLLTGFCLSAENSDYVLQGDATTSGIVTASDAVIKTSSFTVEAWVMPPSGSANIQENDIFSQFAGSGNGGDLIFALYYGEPAMFLRSFNQVSGNAWKRSGVVLPLNRWSHCALTCDGDTMTLYVDGERVLADTRSSAAPLVPANVKTRIGMSKSYKGKICDVRVWSVCRTQDEVRGDLVQGVTGTEEGLAACWPLDDATGTSARELVSGTSSSISGTPVWSSCVNPRSDRGVVQGNRCLSGSDAASAKVTVDGLQLSGPSFTLEAWIRPSKSNLENDFIRQFKGSNTSGDLIFGLQRDTRKLGFFYRSWGEANWMYTDAVLPLHAWSHVAVTCDGDMLKVFFNGQKVSEFPRTGAAPFKPAPVSLALGSDASGGTFYGDLSDVRIWSVCRTEQQVFETFSRKALTGGECGLEAWMPLDEVEGTKAVNRSVYATQHGTLASEEARTAVPTPSGLAMRSKGTEGVAFQVNATAAQTVAGRIACARDFKIRTDAFTVEAWVKPDTLTRENDFFAQFTSGTPGDLLIATGTSTEQKFGVFFRGFGASDWMCGTMQPTCHAWMHCAVVCTGDKLTLYVNGRQDAEFARTAAAPLKPNLGATVFLAGSHSKTYAGCVSDVRIWDVARTASEIAGSFTNRLTGTESGLIAYYPLNDAEGATVVNQSLFGMVDGTIAEETTDMWAMRLMPFSDRTYESSDFQVWHPGAVATDVNLVSPMFTCEAWIRPGDHKDENWVFSQFKGSTGGDFILNVGADGRLRGFLRNFNSNNAVFSTVAVPDGKWSHVAMTCDGVAIRLFLNGQKVGEGERTSSGPIYPQNETKLVVGGDSASRVFRGRISEARVWTVARTEEEIAAGFAGRLTGWEPDLLLNYRLDQMGGTSVWNVSRYGVSHGDARSDGYWEHLHHTPFAYEQTGLLILVQ